MKQICFFIILVTNIFGACQNNDKTRENDRLLAKVYGKSLYLSELTDNLSNGHISKEDSIQLINVYVDTWVKDNLMMYEAEKNIPKDLNVDKLVRDYRASLVRSTYEKDLVEKGLDSTVTMAELTEFYEKNKDQYQLETPIIRCYLIKLYKNKENMQTLKSLWDDIDEGDNIKRVASFCQKNAKVYMLDSKTWYKVEDVAPLLPKGTISNEDISKGELTIKDDDYQYFFKVLELVKKKEMAPVSYIKDQAIRYILHKRKMKLLEQRIEEIYKREIDNKNIQIF